MSALPAEREKAPSVNPEPIPCVMEPRPCESSGAASVAHAKAGCKWTKAERALVWWLLRRFRCRLAWQTYTSMSQEAIGGELGLTRRTVRSGLKRLSSEGYIQRRHQPNPAGGRYPDLLVVDRRKLKGLVDRKFPITPPVFFPFDPLSVAFPSEKIVVVKDRKKLPSLTVGPTLPPDTKKQIPEQEQIPEQQKHSEGREQTPPPIAAAPPVEAGPKDSTMQGRLFAGGGGSRKNGPPKDNARTRLDLYREMWRKRYGRGAYIPNIAVALALVKRWMEHTPTAQHWAVLLEEYFAQDDRNVLDAQHPIFWLGRRMTFLLPAVFEEMDRQARIEKQMAKQRAQDEAMTDLQRRRLKYWGIRDDETVEEYIAKRKAGRERLRQKQMAGLA